jgi:hypothetical protein|tara:strand:- start:307 stop:636 length:330 start_codon:yes stop_codon:yes gene_type:complete
VADKKETRGRPTRSEVRQNMIEILFVMKEAYGYDIYRQYKKIFAPVTLRLIYYHLKKGIELGEFKVSQVKKEKGSFSWGGEVQKTYYALADKAKPKGETRVKEFFEKKG